MRECLFYRNLSLVCTFFFSIVCICNLCWMPPTLVLKSGTNLSMHHCREYLVDLMGKPGLLCEPDSLLNGPSSISISSPLCFPRFRQVEPPVDFRSLAKQYFSDFELLNIVFEDFSTGDLLGLWTCVSQTTDLFVIVFRCFVCVL